MVPPYTAVPMIFCGSRLAGISTTERMPARAAAAATALARFPVDGQARTVKPISNAAASATATTRSLNEWVGLPRSSFTQSVRMPSAAASRSARTRRVPPGSVFGRAAASGGTGSRLAYRQMLGGPASTAARVSAGKS